MKLFVDKDAQSMGERAGLMAAAKINEIIALQGSCRILLSTGASQFETLECLTKQKVDWSKVTMFHLDEYVGLPMTHPASFRKYLTERFIDLVQPGAYYFVNGEGDVEANIRALTQELRRAPIDLALIGIGENSHIAFNDPPADFATREAYIVVSLDERCRQQQLGEGWFATLDDVPPKAISMTPYQIMQSRCVYSIVGGRRKADAIRKMLQAESTTNLVPATLLKEHPDWTLFLDAESASETPELKNA